MCAPIAGAFRRSSNLSRGARRRAVPAAHGRARLRARRPARCSARAVFAALGLLPEAGWAWTLAPQVLVGAGLALSLGALTEAALAGRSPLRSTAAGRSPRAMRASCSDSSCSHPCSSATSTAARARRRRRAPSCAGRARRRAREDRPGAAHRERHPGDPGGCPTSIAPSPLWARTTRSPRARSCATD